MQPSVVEYCRPFATDRKVRGLDIGGRDVFSADGHCARDLWPNARWDVLDLVDAPEVTIVADARTFRSRRRWDVILCTETLEHVEGWPQLIDTAVRHLARGGRLIVTCAGPGWEPHSGFTGELGEFEGEHYENVPADDLGWEMQMAGLTDVQVEQAGRDTHGTGVNGG